MQWHIPIICHLSDTGQHLECRTYQINQFQLPPPAYALHIFHNKYEYRPVNITMSLLHPVQKSQWMNSLETSIFSFVNDTALSAMNNLRKMEIPFLILSTIYNSSTQTHDQLSPSRIWHSNSVYRPADRPPPHNILTTIFRQILQYLVYLFIYWYITYLLHTHIFFIFQDSVALHSTWIHNSTQIIYQQFIF